MEIINAHVHLIELEKMLQTQGETSLPRSISVLKHIESALPMLRPDTLIQQMDEAKVARSILYAVEAPIVYSSNEYVAGLCEAYPDRFIGFASVHPLKEDACRTLEQAVSELGLVGLKLHPPLQQFAPDDERVFPVYETAARLDIPVVFHVGTTPFGSLCRLAHANPLLVDEVAVRYPQLRIMLTHLGTLWHNEAFMVVEKNPNVFIDTAAYIDEIRTILTPDIVRRIGADKIIFGTDYPMPYADKPHHMKEFVDCVAALPLKQDEIGGILHGNVEVLLHGRKDELPDISASQILQMLEQSKGPERGL